MAIFQSIGGLLSNVFLAPMFLWFLGLIPIVILLYLLKLRRTRVVITLPRPSARAASSMFCTAG